MGHLDRYDRYIEQELPRVVRRLLEQEASAFSGPLETHLRGLFERIVREAQAEISQQFRASGDRQEAAIDSPRQEDPALTTNLGLEQPIDPSFQDVAFAFHDPDPFEFNGSE